MGLETWSVSDYDLITLQTSEIGQCTQAGQLHSSLMEDEVVSATYFRCNAKDTFYLQSSDEVKGFVKASELVGKTAPTYTTSTSDDREASATVRSAPQLPTSFVPASKLMSASLSHNHLPPSVRTEDGQRNSSKSSSSSPTDKHPHSSTSHLRRVHVDINDLYEETSSDDDLLPGPPVSGPGMNFQQSSMLSTSSALSHSATTSTSIAACTSAVSSGQEKVTDHKPNITSFFQRQVNAMQGISSDLCKPHFLFGFYRQPSCSSHSGAQETSKQPTLLQDTELDGDNHRSYRAEQVRYCHNYRTK